MKGRFMRSSLRSKHEDFRVPSFLSRSGQEPLEAKELLSIRTHHSRRDSEGVIFSLWRSVV